MDEKIKILDDVFYFFPKPLRFLGRIFGLYAPILDGRAHDSAELYEHLPEWMLVVQDANYSALARDMQPILAKGSVLQIGCGRGDLLKRLALLGVEPLYGLDRCEGMVRAARQRVRGLDGVEIIHAGVEDFDFSPLSPISNVILNNFWGMLPPDVSANLLSRLKTHLGPDGKIIIGGLAQGTKPDYVREAERRAAQELGFVLAYPLFLDFAACGYHSECIPLAGGEYYVLSLSPTETG